MISRPFYRLDYHTHPFQGSRDYEDVRTYAERAIEAGLDGIVFTEHAPLSPSLRANIPGNTHFPDEQIFERYLECARRCREEYGHLIDITIGQEIDYHPRNLDYLEEHFRRFPVEYTGGSVHLQAGYWKPEVAGRTGADFTEYCLRQTLEAVRWGKFSTLHHLDFFRWKREDDFVPERFVNLLDEIFRTMLERNIALEYNTSGYLKEFCSALPCRYIWKFSKKYPLRRTFGSDAHKAERVGMRQDEYFGIGI